MEEELKSKIAETAKQLSLKDEEIGCLKRKLKEEKLQSDKEKVQLNV